MTSVSRSSRCLVVAPNWVGDSVMALPVIDALAAADRHITVLARPHLHSLLQLSPAVAGTLTKLPSSRETVALLREHAFDEAVLLPNSFRAAWLVHRAGIPTRFGYRGNARSLLLRPALHRPPGKHHQQRDYDRLLRAMGAAPSIEPPAITVSAAVSDVADDALTAAGVPPDEGQPPLVGVFAGAEFGASKRWPLERFAEASRQLEQLPEGTRPLLLAGPSELPLAERLQQISVARFPIVGPDLDLAALAGVLQRLTLLITNDSGPMHLAAAVGTPCVAVFGPTDPRRTSPCGDGHHVLWSDRRCSPCFRRRCPLIHHGCMKDIGVEDVLSAADKALQAGRSNQPSS